MTEHRGRRAIARTAGIPSRLERGSTAGPAGPAVPSPTEPLLDLQRTAGNRAVAAWIVGGGVPADADVTPGSPRGAARHPAAASVQREKRRGRSRGTVTISSTENIPAALALDAILRREAGAEARYLKDAMDHMLGCPVYLDPNELADLRNLMFGGKLNMT